MVLILVLDHESSVLVQGVKEIPQSEDTEGGKEMF